MSGVLDGAGLEPAPAERDEPDTPTGVEEPEAPESVEAPATGSEEEPEVPEGAENPDAVRSLISKERKAAREAYARARDLERQLKEQQEAALPLEERIERAEQARQEAELRALRLEVVLEKKVDPEVAPKLASRLSGTTKEELAADADELLSLMPQPRGPGLDGGVRETVAPQKEPVAAHNDFIAGVLGLTKQQ